MKTAANLLIAVVLLLPLAAAIDNRRNQLKQRRSHGNDDGGNGAVASPQRQVQSWQPPSSDHRVSHGSHLQTSMESTTDAASTTAVKCGDVITTDTVISNGLTCNCTTDKPEVQGNTMKHSEEGIVVSGDESWIENNVMERMADPGILVTGREAHVVNNTIHATSNGIRLKQSAWLGFIQGNKVTDAKEDGIYLRANNCTIMENMIVNATNDGIHVEGDVVVMDNNNVTGSRGNGISVLGEANAMLRNKVKGSGDNGVEMEGPLNAAVRTKFQIPQVMASMACGNDIEILNHTIAKSVENGIRLGCDVGPVIY